MGIFNWSSKPNIQHLKEAQDIEGLTAALEHKDRNVRTSAIEALRSINTYKAKEIVEAYTSKKREQAKALTEKGIKLFKDWALKEALECFDNALELDPQCANTWYWKGLLLHVHKNNQQDALSALDTALELEPKHIDALHHKARLLQAWRYDEQLEIYNRILEMEPADTGSLKGKARALAGLKCHAEAITTCQKAIDIAPGKSDLWCELGDILEEAGRKGDSLAAYRRFIELAEEELSVPTDDYSKGLAQGVLRTLVDYIKINKLKQ